MFPAYYDFLQGEAQLLVMKIYPGVLNQKQQHPKHCTMCVCIDFSGRQIDYT